MSRHGLVERGDAEVDVHRVRRRHASTCLLALSITAVNWHRNGTQGNRLGLAVRQRLTVRDCRAPRSPSLLDHFSALSDQRQRWRVLYPLPEILLLVLCATLSGMEDFVEIRLWGEERLEFL